MDSTIQPFDAKRVISIDTSLNQPKYQQIIEAVVQAIEAGTLARGQQLPSISELSDSQKVAKVTVAKAYEELRQRGIIQAQHGKGFYVATTNVRTSLNVFVLFDTLNAYKETLYQSFKDALPSDTALSVFFHHYNLRLFESLIQNNLGSFSQYVVMPHFDEDVSSIVGLIPSDKLLIIDKAVESLTGDYAAVYQDFNADMFNALASGINLIRRYNKLTLVLSEDQFQYVPGGSIEGFNSFGETFGVACAVVGQYRELVIRPGEAYLLFADRDMLQFIKDTRKANLKLGTDVGLISYDDTPMKELLEGGITVISTDFAQMGQTAGRLLLDKTRQKLANPSQLIVRNSL